MRITLWRILDWMCVAWIILTVMLVIGCIGLGTGWFEWPIELRESIALGEAILTCVLVVCITCDIG